MIRTAAVTTAVALLLAGCGSLAPADSTVPVYGIRTDPDQQGLVATYMGGSCDGPARMSVRETADRIDVTVLVAPDPSGADVCAGVGILGTVSARLGAPVGTREVWSGGRQVAPFDGSRVLVPAALPDGFSRSREAGEAADSGVTTSWETSYDQHPARERRDRCTPTQGSLSVEVGRAFAADPESDWTEVGTAEVGTAAADLYREVDADKAVVGWAYVWTAEQGLVEVSIREGCEGDHLLSRRQLLSVARSLRPA